SSGRKGISRRSTSQKQEDNSHVAEAPPLHRPLVDARAVERLAGPEGLGLRLVLDVEDQHAADRFLAVIVDERAARDDDAFVLAQVVEVRGAQLPAPRGAA